MNATLKTKLFALLLGATLAVPTLTACSSEEAKEEEFKAPEVAYEAYDLAAEEDDKFALSAIGVLGWVKDTILDDAEKKAKDYLLSKGSSVVTKAVDWLKGKLFYCLEIENSPEPAEYTSTDVYNKLLTIENDIKALQTSLDILKQQTQDNQYYVKYTAFINSYSEIKTYITTPFSNLETLNGMKPASESEADVAKFEADYNALAKSIEVSLRGEGAYAVPVEQQIELSKKTLAFGNAILGEETSSSLLNSYGIFNILRYFAERETPWIHQRKEIEDIYLSSILYSYRNAHALAIYDLAYQMNLLNCNELYLAPDGTVVAFKYGVGEDAKWHYNAYPYQENKLKSDYAKVFEGFNQTPVSISDIDSAVFSKLSFLFGFYKQNQEQYCKILRALNDFTRELDDKNYVLATQQDRKYAIDIFGCSSRPSDERADTGSFVKFDNPNDDYIINFDQFKNCTKKEFLDFIALIKPYAGDKSLYDYLRYVGFKVPRASAPYPNYDYGTINAMALGIEKHKDRDRQDNSQYPHEFVIHYMNVDEKVKDIGDSSFKLVYYTAQVSWSGVCNDKKHWDHRWSMFDYVMHNGQLGNRNLQKPYYYLSLHGLSTSSKSGNVKRGDLNTSW